HSPPYPSRSPRRRSPDPPLFPYTTLFRSRQYAVYQEPARPGHVSVSGREDHDVNNAGEEHGDAKEQGDAGERQAGGRQTEDSRQDRKSTRLNSSHVSISYAVFCLKKKITH